MTTTSDTIEPTSDTVPVVVRRPSFRFRFLVAFLIGLLAALAVGVGALYAYDQQHAGRILPGVHVGGVDLAGLTADAAAARLNAAFGGLSQGQVVVNTPSGPAGLDYASIGRRADVGPMVTEAMAVGREGSPVDRVIADARTAFRGVDLPIRVTYEPTAVQDWLGSLAARETRPASAAAVTLDDKDITVVPGVEGTQADPTAPTGTVLATLGRVDAPARIEVDLPVATIQPAVTTAAANQAKAAADRIARPVSLRVGGDEWTIPAKTIRSWISFGPTADGGYGAILDTKGLPKVVKNLAKSIDRAPTNATFRISGGRISGVNASKAGRAVNVKDTTAQVEALLAARSKGGADTAVRPALTETKPALTTDEAHAAAPKMRRLPGGTWTTYFPIYINNGFGANIWTPALIIDGYTLAPGQTFDFWQAVGSVSYAKGYRLGGAIINGKTEPQGALAGGICSCSTTLFNAAARAGLQLGARRNHYYYISRYPLGLDATVFRSSAGSTQTMSFTNDTPYPIVIRGYKIRKGSSGYVKFDIWGVPTGRHVSFSKPTVRNRRPAGSVTVYTSSLPPGSTHWVEHPADGMDVWVTRIVRDSKGKVIHKETYYSHYARITGVLQVGRSSAATTGSDSAR